MIRTGQVPITVLRLPLGAMPAPPLPDDGWVDAYAVACEDGVLVLGVDGVLTSPGELEQVVACVERLLADASSRLSA